MSTKKYSHNMQHLVEMFRLETKILSSSEITAPRRLGEVRSYTNYNKENSLSEHQISGIKLRNLAYYAWEDASLWAPWTHSFHTLSQANPFPCSPKEWPMAAACTLPALQQSSWGMVHPLDCSFGSPYSQLEARTCWWQWHFLFIAIVDIFISV